MRPAFLGLNIARSALFASQQQLDVTSHNIANASVEGYSRQRLDLQAAPDIFGLGYPGAVGEGVRVEQLERLRNELLDKDYRRYLEQQSQGTVQQGYLERMEVLFGDLDDTGLQSQLDQFFSAWQELSKRPDDLALRKVVLERAQILADQIQQVDAGTRELQADAQQELNLAVERVNRITAQISDLNTEIAKRFGGGDTPADLLDQRDRLLDELAGYAKIQVIERNNHTIEVQIDGKSVVDDQRSHPIRLVQESDILRGQAPVGFPNTLSNGDLVINGVDIIGSGAPLTINSAADYGLLVDRINSQSSATGVRASLDPAGQLVLQGLSAESSYVNIQQSGVGLNLTGIESGDFTLTSRSRLQLRTGTFIHNAGGSLDGLQTVRNQAIPNSLQGLNALSSELIQRVNQIHEASFDLQGQSGRPFFTGNHPGNLAVAASLLADPSKLSIAGSASFPPGDGSQALSIANLRNQLNTDEDYQRIVSNLGFSIQRLKENEERFDLILTQIDFQRQSESGVNLDEELANMLQYQRSFNAAARVMNTLDEMLNQVVNGLGLVGR